MSLDRVARRLRGEVVCAFDWPGTFPGSRKTCDGVVVAERDGKPCCASHAGTRLGEIAAALLPEEPTT